MKKRQIRHGVFETNSSSTHAISIAEAPTFNDTITPDANDCIILQGDEFGWEWAQYTDAATKAAYCTTYAYQHSNDDTLIEMLKHVIQEYTGVAEVIFDPEDYCDGSSWYIDHQSSDTAAKAFASEDALKRFLFSTESVLITGNDNSDVPPGYEQYFDYYDS